MSAAPVARAEVATVVHIPWETLDRKVVAALRALLRRSHQSGTAVVLDLSMVTFVDSFALGVLVAAHRQLRAEGTGLIMANAQDRVLRVLRSTGLVHQPDTVSGRPHDFRLISDNDILG